jgi:rubrerythrin
MSDANMELRTIKEVLDFAIEAEVQAAQVYRDLAGSAVHQDLRTLLLALADVEEEHWKSLEEVREGDLSLFARKAPVVQLSVPCFVPELSPEMTLAQLLLAAIDAERRAHELYSGLAREAIDPGLATLLDALAREEINHWQQLQQAYDTFIAGGSSE